MMQMKFPIIRPINNVGIVGAQISIFAKTVLYPNFFGFVPEFLTGFESKHAAIYRGP
jgi:hypothetical protein